MNRFLTCCVTVSAVVAALPRSVDGQELGFSIRQITAGPRHHFFGYIGHVGTVPWNASGRYVLALRTDVQGRLPGPDDPAEIVLLDAKRNFASRVVDRTLAWNPQQGTMLYWNPDHPETQFFFNDRDPETNKLFTVLFDISQGEAGRRVREYRLPNTPVANSGVAQPGGYFLAINYARLARWRPVTGYREAWDWTVGDNAPADDGIFKIDISTGQSELLVSFRRLRERLRSTVPNIDARPLFINHTLCSRDGQCIYFFVRANFATTERLDLPFTVDADGRSLQQQQYIGGHPEWAEGRQMIGSLGGRQIVYDVDRREAVDALGNDQIFPHPGGDIALSPDATMLVNGHGLKQPGVNYYTIFRLADGRWIRTGPFVRGQWTSGDLRLDPAPRWDRESRHILVSAIANDPGKTRQLFIIRISSAPGGAPTRGDSN